MLKLENVSKFYYSSTSVVCALRKINLEFNIGEFVAITGESGSGKTTLINVLSGLDSYEDGEFYFKNKKTSYYDAEDWENYRKNEIAFIFQNYNLIDSFTVLENVVVTYIIEGYSYSEAKIKAVETLKLVGLENDTHKKATKLSGGQKQRLAIARALAKNTNIIIADEPTGNLDAENGKAILELLKSVSKDKLVIVVSHNLSEIEPFMTRKIRLHDGEVVLDEKIVKKEEVKEVLINKNDDKKDIKKVFNFSFLNVKSQPKKTLLMLLLVIICVFSSFVFYANFKANIDDNKTKTLETDFFLNFDETRLIVKNSDSSLITEDSLEKANVKRVYQIEKYDYITDVNYYRSGDYKWKLAGGMSDSFDGSSSFIDSSAIELIKNDKFMRSASSLSEDDLSYGRLPNSMLEMVVYSNDQSIIGTKELVLFKNTRKWGIDAYFKYNVEIVGVLKENTNQAYFSDEICKMLELSDKNLEFNIEFLKNSYSLSRFKFNKVAIDPTLEGMQVVVHNSVRNVLLNPDYVIPEYYLKIRCDYKDIYYGNLLLNLTISQNICDDAIVMSLEAFEYIYSQYNLDTQFAVFIDDYSYTDDVIKSLSKEGFVSISCFRSSVSGYDIYKVIIRYVNLLISIIALLIINILVIFIGLSILKVKRNDFIIFKMIGLTNKLIRKINIIELLFYGVVSNILLIIVFLIVNNTTTSQLIIDVLKYIKFYDFIIILLITLLSMLSLSKKFNKFITGKTKITVLKEE